MAKLMKVCIIMYNLVLKVRRNSYESESFRRALSAAGRCEVLDEKRNEVRFKWASIDGLSNGTNTMNKIASTVAVLDVRITEES